MGVLKCLEIHMFPGLGYHLQYLLTKDKYYNVCRSRGRLKLLSRPLGRKLDSLLSIRFGLSYFCLLFRSRRNRDRELVSSFEELIWLCYQSAYAKVGTAAIRPIPLIMNLCAFLLGWDWLEPVFHQHLDSGLRSEVPLLKQVLAVQV